MTIPTGGFSGDNALLAFAAVQQGRMNDELNESMRSADLRSQIVKETGDLKARIQDITANSPNDLPTLDAEIQAFTEKYKDVPEAQDILSTMEPFAKTIHDRVAEYRPSDAPTTTTIPITWSGGRGGAHGTTYINVPYKARDIPAFDKDQVKGWLGNLQETVDASNVNDQLAMVHMKQLNDAINNSSGIVSGILESRQNATAGIIANLA